MSVSHKVKAKGRAAVRIVTWVVNCLEQMFTLLRVCYLSDMDRESRWSEMWLGKPGLRSALGKIKDSELSSRSMEVTEWIPGHRGPASVQLHFQGYR